jgi:hypothetical protein
MNASLLLLVGAAVALTVMILLSLISSLRQKRWLFALIPAALIFATSTYVTIESIMGMPLKRLPSEKFVFLEYVTDGKVIFVWLIEPGKSYPTTVQFPYSEQLHKQLEQGRQGKKQGKLMLGKKSKEGQEGEPAPGEFRLYEFSPMSGQPDKDRQ